MSKPIIPMALAGGLSRAVELLGCDAPKGSYPGYNAAPFAAIPLVLEGGRRQLLQNSRRNSGASRDRAPAACDMRLRAGVVRIRPRRER